MQTFLLEQSTRTSMDSSIRGISAKMPPTQRGLSEKILLNPHYGQDPTGMVLAQ